MTLYRLNANPAEVRDGCFSVSYSWLNKQLIDATITVDVRSADELKAAKLGHGLMVLARNATRPIHPDMTCAPRPLEVVAVDHTPITRHANGCKALPISMLITRPQTPTLAEAVAAAEARRDLTNGGQLTLPAELLPVAAGELFS